MSDNFDYKIIPPFNWFVLENFPFIEADFDAITPWQMWCKLGKEMNKIINSQNIVGEQVEELTNAYNVLKNYIDNYFKNLDVQDEVNNKLNQMAQSGYFQNLIESAVGQYKRLYNAEYGVNGWWANANGTLRSDRYNYRDNGITAIYQDIDDYADIGLTQMCLPIQLVRSDTGFEISGGNDYLNDLLDAVTYAENKGITVDTIRIMGTTTSTAILNSAQKTSYLGIIDTILAKFSNAKYKYFNVLNEIHTTIIDDYSFAVNCVNKVQLANKKAIVSIELLSSYANNQTILDLLETVDVIGLNIYPRCLAEKDCVNPEFYNIGVEKTLARFEKIQALNKPIFITETGVIDYYIAGIRCSLSSVPSAFEINSYGLNNKTLIEQIFKYYGNSVERIYNWWTSGLTYPTTCKPNSKKLCESLLQKVRE